MKKEVEQLLKIPEFVDKMFHTKSDEEVIKLFSEKNVLITQDDIIEIKATIKVLTDDMQKSVSGGNSGGEENSDSQEMSEQEIAAEIERLTNLFTRGESLEELQGKAEDIRRNAQIFHREPVRRSGGFFSFLRNLFS